MSLLNQIEENTLTNLRLSHEDEDMIDNVRQLITALESNTSIESVRFEGEYLGCLRGDARNEIIEVVGGLPNLQEVHMGQSLLAAKGLATMVTKAKSLRILKLDNVVFQGVEDDISSLELTLLAHSSLKEFDLKDCSAAAVHDAALDKLEKAGKKINTVTSEAGSPTDVRRVSATVA